jgi:galactokinase
MFTWELMPESTNVAVGATDLKSLFEVARRTHEHRYGLAATLYVAAPGRVNLIGDHTDYNDGLVFPMAIDRFVVIAASPSISALAPASALTLYSDAEDQSAEIDLSARPSRTSIGWANYATGVVAGLLDRRHALRGAALTITSSLPIGAGLSSSAALEVAVATALEELNGFRLEPLEKARLCQAAEHEFAGVPCGIMDQLSSVCGRRDRALFIDCRTLAVREVPLSDPGVSVLVCNSNTSHSLASSEYAARRADCERAARQLDKTSLRDVQLAELPGLPSQLTDTLVKRVRHVVTENQRVEDFSKALAAGDWDWAGKLMYESHASLRDDYEVSCTELDCLVEAAHALGIGHGIFGSRMTGGGFGGSTVSLVRTERVADVVDAIGSRYRAETGKAMTAFVTRPEQGSVYNPARRTDDTFSG